MHQAIEHVYWDHRQGLYTLALAITRCPGRAEDAVQEVFARLWSRRERVAGDLVAYIFAAVRNAAIDQVRRGTRGRPLVPASIFNGLPADPAEVALTEEEHRRVREAVESLPRPQREAIVMRTYAGLTFRQMAEVLDEPLQTVASRYRRALNRIAQRL